jgi:endonuclease/exonuclease/phosphatase family metal-dependent hydrolase
MKLFPYFSIFFIFIQAQTIKINLVTTNDMHGVIGKQEASFMNPQYPPTIIGGAAFSKYVDELKIEAHIKNEGVIILDGGNFFQGNPLGLYDGGKTMIEWMNRIGYDAMVPGIYDFILGDINLNELSKNSTFPFLFSNIECLKCPLTSNNIIPYIVKDIENVKVGILGIVNSKIENFVLKENLFGTNTLNEIESIQKWIPELKKEGAEIIIVLTSSGVPWNREKEYELFKNKVEKGKITEKSSLNALEMTYFLKDVDFVVAGGNSKGYTLPWYDPHSHVYVMQGYGGGTEFSHVKLLVDKETHLFMGYETVIDGKASQTLLADDFSYDQNDYDWIESKINASKNMTFKREFPKLKGFNEPSYDDKWNFPNINHEDKIEIVTWNCEFFPHSNDSTISALSEAINELNADIIAFQELREVGWFGKLMQNLPQYNYVVSHQASFMDLAIIYKKELFKLIEQNEPFAENDYNFAGRSPLQADLIFTDDNKEIPLTIINLHMKCCDSGLSRRKRASMMLHDYLDANFESQSNIIVLGDWNDDTKDKPGQHCFDPFFSDDRFFFVTKEISKDIKQASYPKEPYVSFLDHILISTSLINNKNYDVMTIPMGKYMGGYDIYDAYVSDHLPVLLSFSVTN